MLNLPYAEQIKLAGALGFGVPLLAWLSVLIALFAARRCGVRCRHRGKGRLKGEVTRDEPGHRRSRRSQRQSLS
ncbi:hypothetical protein, partial [Xanthomonas albilineans]|uniref:hypothetical protein n=1 Tax=Xanthomonas albilineans TaxID=29447 RepID=UPI001E5537EB